MNKCDGTRLPLQLIDHSVTQRIGLPLKRTKAQIDRNVVARVELEVGKGTNEEKNDG